MTDETASKRLTKRQIRQQKEQIRTEREVELEKFILSDTDSLVTSRFVFRLLLRVMPLISLESSIDSNSDWLPPKLWVWRSMLTLSHYLSKNPQFINNTNVGDIWNQSNKLAFKTSVEEAVIGLLNSVLAGSHTDSSRAVASALQIHDDSQRLVLEAASTAMQTYDTLNARPIELELIAKEIGFLKDIGDTVTSIHLVWPETKADKWPKEAMLSSMAKQNPDWQFWSSWYLKLINARDIDWNLTNKIVSIPDADWEKGPAHIAEKIRDIQADYQPQHPDHVPNLETKKLQKQINKLLAQPIVSEEIARSTARQLEQIISQYKADAPANQLPDGMEPLETLPKHFRAIADVFACNTTIVDKAERLEATIHALNKRIAELEASLEIALSKTVKGHFTQAACTAFGKNIGNGILPGALAVETLYFFGIVPQDITFQNLRDYISGFPSSAPPLDALTFGPTTDA